jgi:hypothetical protein
MEQLTNATCFRNSQGNNSAEMDSPNGSHCGIASSKAATQKI